jgi:FkbM family methyltransferase
VRKLRKLFAILSSGHVPWLRALRLGVPAGIEHEAVLRSLECRTVVDVGANRGQFALSARRRWPTARVISFEPLDAPAESFLKVFGRDREVSLHRAAIGPRDEMATMHVSRRDDSSSLLAITSLQDEIFPGTDEVGTASVKVAPLAAFVEARELVGPALLKIDVQGFELEVLHGCEALLPEFEIVYCECSFVELYEGQGLVADVITWLAERGFAVTGVFNPSYDREGRAVQADFLFTRRRIRA